MDSNAPVDFFLHIPRTGGSSIRTLLTLNYKKEHTFAFSGNAEEFCRFMDQPLERRKSYDLIHGHFPFGLHAGIQTFRYFTLLRDPVLRHFSEYYYAKKHSDHFAHKAINEGDLTIEKWAEIGNYRTTYHNNTMCQYLSGDFLLNKPTYATYQAACSNLEKFHIFGLTERFAESALIMAKYLGWKYPVYEKRNVVMSNQQLPQDALRKAQKHFEWDLMLFEYAQELFEKRIHEESKSLFPALESYLQRVDSTCRMSADNRYLVGDDLSEDVLKANQLEKDSPIQTYLESPCQEHSMKLRCLPEKKVADSMKTLHAANVLGHDIKVWNDNWTRVWWLGLVDIRQFPSVYHAQYGWFTCNGKDDQGNLILGFHDHRVGKVVTNWNSFPEMRTIQSGQKKRFQHNDDDTVRLEVLIDDFWQVLEDPYKPQPFWEMSDT